MISRTSKAACGRSIDMWAGLHCIPIRLGSMAHYHDVSRQRRSAMVPHISHTISLLQHGASSPSGFQRLMQTPGHASMGKLETYQLGSACGAWDRTHMAQWGGEFRRLATRTDAASASSGVSSTGAADMQAAGGLRQVCVFCGSSSGSRPEYESAAVALGNCLVHEGIHLVYGGGNVGLMGAIARTVQQGLGDDGVLGIIPESMKDRELIGDHIGRLQMVTDFHSRKAMMAKCSDGFIAMPGGFGTMEELMEVITWQQLGFHAKPIGLFNVAGFFDPLVAFFQHCVEEGFVKQEYCTVIVSSDPAELVRKMREFKAPESVIERHKREQLRASGNGCVDDLMNKA